MCTIADINLPLVRSQMPYHILRPKAIPYRPNLLTSQLRPHLHQTGVNDGVDCRGQMAALRPTLCQLGHQVKAFGRVEGNRVAIKEIRHHDEVAVCGELVGDELDVVESVAYDIGDEEDGPFGRFIFRVGEVGLDVADRLHLTSGCAFVLDAGVAAGSGRVRGHDCK